MKIRASHKIFIGGAAGFAALYFGWQAYASMQVDRIQFSELQPGSVTLFGIDTGKGFKIIVANESAQLIQFTGTAEDLQVDVANIDKIDESQKSRVPLREMVKALQGDEKALGEFITRIDQRLRKLEMPPVEVVWKAPDIRKALDGDKALRAKLEKDLNMSLDGKPLMTISPAALQNGIVVESYVPITVAVGGAERLMKGPIRVPYRPRFVEKVTKRYEQVFKPTKEIILANYQEEMKALKDRPGDVENVAEALEDRIDEKTLAANYADAPARVLQKAKVVLSDQQITGASMKVKDGAGTEKYADLYLRLTEEGRKRIWQYSRRHPGRQLLLIRDGIAVAAPRISQEIAQSEVTIHGVGSPDLAQETVDAINAVAKKGS